MRGQQRLRIRMARIVKDLLGRSFLDDLSEIHHRHAVAEIAHRCQVVADEEITDADSS